MKTRATCIFTLTLLVDKLEAVGPNIIESILMNYFLVIYERVYQPADVSPEKKCSETLKTFQMLLDTLEPYFVWEYVTKYFEMVFNSTTRYTLEQICGIISMLLDIAALESDADIQSEHLPTMLSQLIEIIDHHLEKLSSKQISSCLALLLQVFGKLPPKTTTTPLSSRRRSLENHRGSIEKEQADTATSEVDSSISNEVAHLLSHMVRQVEERMKATLPNTSTASSSLDLIDRVIQLYQRLFHHFIVQFLVHPTHAQINKRFQSMSSLLRNRTTGSLSTILDHYQGDEHFQLKLNDHADDYLNPFEECCKLLLRCASYSREDPSVNPSSNGIRLDDWLIDLCVLSLCHSDHFTLRTMVISLLIELFDVTLKSPYAQLMSLLNESDFFEYLIAELWNYLSDQFDREHHIKAAQLLSLLHSMLPNDLCDELIGHQLALVSHQSNQYRLKITNEYQRFFKLWHYTRDESSNRSSKSFQRCLLSILSILHESKHYSLKSAVQQWTHDCFAHGDTGRVFDILLTSLLHPDTVRTSIQRLDQKTYEDFFLNSRKETATSNGIEELRVDETDDRPLPPVAFDDQYDDEYMRDYDNEHEESDEDNRVCFQKEFIVSISYRLLIDSDDEQCQ